jgi:thiamine biosynthesis lipoprotein
MTVVRSSLAAWLTAPAMLAASAVPARAEVYLNEAQALSVILGENSIPRREQKALDADQRTKLERAINLRFPESSYTFFIAGQPGQPHKYAIVMNEIGKSEPITFMVGMDDQGKVTGVVIMEFRENRGWEVKEKRFLNQFRGKTVHSSIRVDEDIINYTGATLSSKAVARGVKRALLLLDSFYPAESRRTMAPARDFARPHRLTPLLTASTRDGRIGLHRQMRYAMGSLCEIRLWSHSADDAYRAFRAGFAEIERIERRFSAYCKDSELSLVNREAGRTAVPVSLEFFQLTQYAIRSWYSSCGIADITVGPLMELWGFHHDEPRLPNRAEILATRRLVGCDKLELDQRCRTLRFRRPGMKLDFGGFAKGYAAELVAQKLQQEGVIAALVNLGRSSLCATHLNGSPGDENPSEQTGMAFGEWLIGVTHPDSALPCPVYIRLTAGESLSTSGTYERRLRVGGRYVSHILNPRTGCPLGGLRSVTTVTQSGPHGEVLGKQLLIQSERERSSLFKHLEGEKWLQLEVPTKGGRLTFHTNVNHDCLFRV